MSHRDPPSKYGFPPLLDQRLPAEVPWDTPIAELSGLSLSVTCDCGRSLRMPLRLLAATIGHKRTLRIILPKIVCKTCGAKPVHIALVAPGHNGSPDYRAPELVLREEGE